MTMQTNYVTSNRPHAGRADRHEFQRSMAATNAVAIIVGLVMTLGPLTAYALGAR